MRANIIAVLLIFLCANVCAVEIVEKNIEAVNGAQLFVLSPEYNGDYGVFFSELAGKGIDTVFVRVFHNAGDRTHSGVDNPCPNGGVYFTSDIACTVDDILPAMLEAAHNNGIRLYAWMASRSLSFLKTPDKIAMSFNPNGEPVPGYGANIFNHTVRASIKRLFSEIAETGVDGILLQDDFIMKYSEGADPLACGKFTTDTGLICAKDSFFEMIESGGAYRFGKATETGEAWYQWKAAQMQEFLKEIRSQVRLIDPAAKIAVNIYYETPIFPHQGLAWYAQDMDGILSTGVDYLAVMAYQEQIISEKNLDKNSFLDFITELSVASLNGLEKNERIIFKVQAKNFGNKNKVDETELKLLYNRIERAGGRSIVQLPIYCAEDIFYIER